MSHNPTPLERIEGCLLGGAIGDALGYQVEFLSWKSIAENFGPDGVTELRSNLISDDTQMTLFSTQGLLQARPGKEFGAVRNAYMDWLDTQRLPMPHSRSRGLATEEWLYQRRAPGNACLTGLREGGRPGVNPGSKGCGSVMRSAPFGLIDLDPTDAFELAQRCSAITHGHPTAGESSGSLAMIISYLMTGHTIQRAVDETILYLQRDPAESETVRALNAAYELSGRVRPGPNTARHLGEGWVAEETLAIAVYCALGSDDPAQAITAAVSHGGDSDSTGAVCGNIVGTLWGTEGLPDPWKQVEGGETVRKQARLVQRQFH
ncbi:ADP-ribosylglycohydrolase family protein [Haloglycomyces albus]|uniref:ADP-ribosylglycohydrolase family protein n=1 Tax=Haloglycomyces albus TaxID=526067 RepID=UPI00046D8595|nr:ADP-ribosylglycohydrolase family protein [Haloglycomyces albus]